MITEKERERIEDGRQWRHEQAQKTQEKYLKQRKDEKWAADHTPDSNSPSDFAINIPDTEPWPLGVRILIFIVGMVILSIILFPLAWIMLLLSLL